MFSEFARRSPPEGRPAALDRRPRSMAGNCGNFTGLANTRPAARGQTTRFWRSAAMSESP
jgi:hypothetical protein